MIVAACGQVAAGFSYLPSHSVAKPIQGQSVTGTNSSRNAPAVTHLLPSLRHSKKPSIGMTQRFHLTRRENTGFSHTVSDLGGKGADEHTGS